MAIRKTGSVTGEVTGVEQVPENLRTWGDLEHDRLPGLTPVSARDRERFQREAARAWNERDECELIIEDDDSPVQS